MGEVGKGPDANTWREYLTSLSASRKKYTLWSFKYMKIITVTNEPSTPPQSLTHSLSPFSL